MYNFEYINTSIIFVWKNNEFFCLNGLFENKNIFWMSCDRWLLHMLTGKKEYVNKVLFFIYESKLFKIHKNMQVVYLFFDEIIWRTNDCNLQRCKEHPLLPIVTWILLLFFLFCGINVNEIDIENSPHNLLSNLCLYLLLFVSILFDF